MQLLSVGVARSIWLFDPNELNPSGKSLFPEILSWAAERYSFQTFPKTIAEVDEKVKGYVFKIGQFHSEDGSITVNFSFHNDGLVAESWATTEKTDSFLDDLLRSASQRYGLAYNPQMIRSKRYISEINIALDAQLSHLNPKLLRLCEMMNAMFESYKLPSFELTGMVFGLDSSNSAYKPPGLMIERKAGVPYSENRFWSQSPFSTKDHIALLEQFELLLSP